MPAADYRYPGGYAFVNALAGRESDPALAPQVGRLEPVRAALGYCLNATQATDGATRSDLLRRAGAQAVILQAGIAVISEAIGEVTQNFDDAEHPNGGQPLMGALQPALDRPSVMAAGPPPPGETMEDPTPRVEREGADEGMSGAPPRPDTGVNQTFNQVDMPSQYEQPVMDERTYKQRDNPPYTEPTETDQGTAPAIMQGEQAGTGWTPEAQAAEQALAPASSRPRGRPRGRPRASRSVQQASTPQPAQPEQGAGGELPGDQPLPETPR